MYWKHNGNSSQIDVILCKEDCKLLEILDQEDLLQELKGQNLKLIEYLLRGDVIEELVSLIITEPSKELPEKEQYKHASIACELLTCDLPALNERLASNHALLDRLYSFLDTESALNPLLASYFSRTLTILISRRSEQNWYSYQMTCLQALEFLKSKDRFVELLLRHLGTSAIMDLTLNLITLIEDTQLKHNSRDWLLSQNIVPSLISLLSPSVDVECQNNAAQLLCDIIYKLRYTAENDEVDPILAQLESTNMVCFLMDTIFNAERLSETGVVGGLIVLMEILRPFSAPEPQSRRAVIYSVHDNNENFKAPEISPTDSADEAYTVTNIVNGVLPFISHLKNVLLHPPEKPPFQLTSGLMDPPFGKVRLHLVRFITMLVGLNSTNINEELVHLDVFTTLLDLFVKYSCNNFLHTEVEKCISYTVDFCDSMESLTDQCLFKHILEKCRLLQRLLDALEENEMEQHRGGHRKGYMGHLMLIFSIIHYKENKSTVARELIENCLDEKYSQAWLDFKTCCLNRIIELHSTPLGGVLPRPIQNENEIIEDVRELAAENKSFKIENNSIVTYSDDDDEKVVEEQSSDFVSSNGDTTEANDDQREKREDMFNSICAQKWQSVSKDLNNWDDDETDIFAESDTSSSLLARMNKEVGGNEETQGLLLENRDEEKDPWSKIGNVSNPWGSTFSSEQPAVDSNWATFDESLTDVFFNSNNNNNNNNTDSNNTAISCDVSSSSSSSSSALSSDSGENNSVAELSIVEPFGNQYGTIGEKSDKKNESVSFDKFDDRDFNVDRSSSSSSGSLTCDNICGSLFASDAGNFFVPEIDKQSLFYDDDDDDIHVDEKKKCLNNLAEEVNHNEISMADNRDNNVLDNNEAKMQICCNGNVLQSLLEEGNNNAVYTGDEFEDNIIKHFIELKIESPPTLMDENRKSSLVDGAAEKEDKDKCSIIDKADFSLSSDSSTSLSTTSSSLTSPTDSNCSSGGEVESPIDAIIMSDDAVVVPIISNIIASSTASSDKNASSPSEKRSDEIRDGDDYYFSDICNDAFLHTKCDNLSEDNDVANRSDDFEDNVDNKTTAAVKSVVRENNEEDSNNITKEQVTDDDRSTTSVVNGNIETLNEGNEIPIKSLSPQSPNGQDDASYCKPEENETCCNSSLSTRQSD